MQLTMVSAVVTLVAAGRGTQAFVAPMGMMRGASTFVGSSSGSRSMMVSTAAASAATRPSSSNPATEMKIAIVTVSICLFLCDVPLLPTHSCVVKCVVGKLCALCSVLHCSVSGHINRHSCQRMSPNCTVQYSYTCRGKRTLYCSGHHQSAATVIDAG